jgi:TetR/AcrR family transcriptional regulator, copper-responsive repressor
MVQKEEKRGRGRPRSFDEGEVLEKARGVFWDQGYAATSLDDIARATGLNRPSLYGAFGDKHALYLAAVNRTCAQSLAAMTAMLERDGPVREVLSDFYAAAIRVYRSGDAGARGCFVIGTAVTEALGDADTRAVLAQYLADTDALFTARFKRAKAAGDFKGKSRAGGAMASAALHTLAIRARAGESEAALREVADAAVKLICS